MKVIFSLRFLYCPGQDVERYPNGIRLDKEMFFNTPSRWTKIFERFFLSFNKLLLSKKKNLHHNIPIFIVRCFYLHYQMLL